MIAPGIDALTAIPLKTALLFSQILQHIVFFKINIEKSSVKVYNCRGDFSAIFSYFMTGLYTAL